MSQWGTALGLALVASLIGCQSDPKGKPVWSSSEEPRQARRSPSGNPSSSSSSAPDPRRVAPPLVAQNHPPPCAISDREEELVAGETVLVSPIRVNFLVATVVRPQRNGKVVVASRHGNEFEADPSQVYALRAQRHSKARPHCYGACKPTSGWVPCRVTAVSKGSIEALDRTDTPLTLKHDQVVVFDPPLQKQVRAFFVEASIERAFRAAVKRAGTPRTPKGFRCARGQVVLVPFGTRHLLAQVTERDGAQCSVSWLGSSMSPARRPANAMVPLPDGEPGAIAPGDIVLAPARVKLVRKMVPLLSDSDTARAQLPEELWGEWEPMRVEAVYESGQLELSDGHGKRHRQPPARVVPFEHR